MLQALARFLARVLVEFGLVLLLAGGLLLFVAYRLVRRLVTEREDALESYSRPLLRLAGALAELVAVTQKRA